MAVEALDLIDSEFGAAIRELVERGPIVWDDELGGWLVTGYEEAALVLRDDDLFTRDDRFRPGGARFWRKGMALMEGATHRRVHSFHSRHTGSAYAERIRATIARPIAEQLLAPLVNAGRGDLAAEYGDRMPMLVGATLMGFEIEDESFRSRLLELARVRDRWKESFLSGSGCPLDHPIAMAGNDAVEGLYELFLPTIRRRRDHPEDDLISLLWREGLEAFDDWDEEDMMGACWSDVFGGETKLLMRNMFYVLSADPELFAALKAGRSPAADFVEEALRLVGPVRSLNKLVMRDTAIGGQPVRAGERVFVVIAGANRAPAVWDNPSSMRVGRENAESNLSFGQGPRYCVGRYLARMEATEAVQALVSAVDAVRLDTEAAPPMWHGVHTRSIYPLHVVFG